MPTADELYEEAKCFLCYGMTQAQALKLALLRRQVLGLDPDADVSPETLLLNASCYNCYANGSVYDLLELALLAIIAATPCTPGNVDGLIWGPAPETVVTLSDGGDVLLNSLNASFLSAYTTLSFGNPTTVTTDVSYTASTITTELEFRLLETVGTFMTVSGSVLESIVADSLVSVSSDLLIGDCPALTVASFESLVLVPGLLYLQNNTLLTSFTLPALTTTNQIQFDGGGLLTLSLPALTAYPALGITADGTLQTLVLTSCVDDGAGQLDTDLQNMTSLVTLNMASLTSVTQITLNTVSLTSINLDSLQTSLGSVEITLVSVPSVTLPSLTGTAIEVLINNLPNCTSISLPVFVTCPGNFAFNNSPALSSFSAPLWVPTDGFQILFNDCALDVPSVELILRRCVLAGLVASTIDLSGGTNAGTASLSAQGQADVATLGAQVTMNP